MDLVMALVKIQEPKFPQNIFGPFFRENATG